MTHKNDGAWLDIYEPPRFFDAFLRGRARTEPVLGSRCRARNMKTLQEEMKAAGFSVSP
jgi:hypothetical protein